MPIIKLILAFFSLFLPVVATILLSYVWAWIFPGSERGKDGPEIIRAIFGVATFLTFCTIPGFYIDYVFDGKRSIIGKYLEEERLLAETREQAQAEKLLAEPSPANWQ